MSEQLELFGAAPDQNTFQSALWGLLTFFPTKGDEWKDTCRHCLLWNRKQNVIGAECHFAPCESVQRADGRHGYYSIHEMPSLKTKKQ